MARNVLIALGAFGVLLVGGCGVLLVAGGAAVDKAAESIDKEIASSTSTTAESVAPAEPSTASGSESSFVDGVLTTPKMIIKITDKKVIPVGEPGNEYGDKPVIAFWYETTNLTDGDVSPMNWVFVFSAYQDNDPNAVNELDLASLPDPQFLENQMVKIKKGGTVASAVAYELDDQTTPVELVASEGLGSHEIGRMTYNFG
ncbi:MAG TPA: DUF5067 domain-containing protein [Microthrixaceae bacterium]|nr:DUF5067 domain-containing protein [Microthrixaceae bacterium]HNA36025.1 DUF5067 domain-containing protein [Microthrixaceae bacterium]HNK39358.1 DUF5067 domain-containing protein [Microthrixaceae bacterium]HNM20654.1 DUF5067 domain-containing protein [Nitrospira sp.]